MEREYPKVIGTIPDEAGRVVSAKVWNGLVFAACEHGVYLLVGEKFEPVDAMMFDPKESA